MRTSSRERAIITSPAWFTSRSSSCERTRTECPPAARRGAGAGAAPNGARNATGGASGWESPGAGAGAGADWTTCASCPCSAAGAAGSAPVARSASKLACNASKLTSKGSMSAAATVSVSICSTAVSMRCAISPSRIAPARRALPLRVCRARSSSLRAPRFSGRDDHWRNAPPSVGSSSTASSSKMGNRSGSMLSSATMSSSISTVVDTAGATVSPITRSWLTGSVGATTGDGAAGSSTAVACAVP